MMKDYKSSEDVAELQFNALIILQMTAAVGWLTFIVGQFLYSEITKVRLPNNPIWFLIVALIISYFLRRNHRINEGAWVLIGGLLITPTLFLGLYGPNFAVYFFFMIPVVATSMLIGGFAELKLTGLIWFLIISLTLAWQPNISPNSLRDTLAITWAPCLACLFTAIIAHLNNRNIITMAEWALQSQKKDAQRNEILYSQQQQLENALKELGRTNSQLQLVNAQLAQARQVADQANRTKTQFLANVSHELRNPVNVMIGYSQAIMNLSASFEGEKNLLSAAILRNLNHISQSGEHLNRLINDLLDLTRAEMDVLQLYLESIEIHSFLTDVFYTLADAHPSGRNSQVGPQWRLILPDRLPHILADPLRLRQILLNLLNNAFNHTSKGQITLGAEVTLPQLHIWVADTGSGIPVEMQVRIFEPFVSGNSEGKMAKGIGLGLSISQRLANLHGGSITLESQPGVGSTLHLYIPLPSLQGQPILLQADISSNKQAALLVLSEYENIAIEIIEFSQRQKLALVRLTNKDSLAKTLKDFFPSGLAWDLSKASLSDWQLVRELKSYPQMAQLPVIFYGQYSDETGASLGVGLTDFLLKPLSGETLITSVHEMQSTTGYTSILIVDDSKETRDFYQNLLTQAYPDYQVRAATGGEEALELLSEKLPSLIILDLVMPDMDGFTVLEHIRTNPLTRKIPVLVLSDRMLTLNDIERLNHSHVTFQSKDILTSQELQTQMGRFLDVTENTLSKATSLVVKQTLVYMHQNYMHNLTRQEIAAFVGVSERHLSRVFQTEIGISAWDYLVRFRILQAKSLLRSTDETISLVANRVGFNDISYFNKVFRKEVGLPPQAYRENSQN